MKKEIIGILLFFLVILTFVSLFSYSSADTSVNHNLFSAHRTVGIHNLFGPLGAYFSGALIDLFGLGSFWIPIILLVCSINYLKGRSGKIILLTLCGGLLLVISTGSFLSVFYHEYFIFSRAFSSGGIIGLFLSDKLLAYANTAGCIIVLVCLFSMGFVLATGVSIFTFAVAVKKLFFKLLLIIFKTVREECINFGKFFNSMYSAFAGKIRQSITGHLNEKRDDFAVAGETDAIKDRDKTGCDDKTGGSGISGKFNESYENNGTIKIDGREFVSVKAGYVTESSESGSGESVKSKEVDLIVRIEPDVTIFDKFEDIRENKDFSLPPVSLLKEKEKSKTSINIDQLKKKGQILEEKLSDFNISGEVVEILPGPVITTFEYRPAPGVKISKIVNLTDDLALALSAMSIRIIAPIPGKDVVGIEIPNEEREIVLLRELISSKAFAESSSKLTLCMGKNIVGSPIVAQLEKMPHLLIAGATGTGKSVGLNAMITSLLYKACPDEVKFIMIDPKRIELSVYDGIPHLISPVVTDMKKATNALLWAVREMERRYELLARTGVRNILQYNDFVDESYEKKNKTDKKRSGNGKPEENIKNSTLKTEEDSILTHAGSGNGNNDYGKYDFHTHGSKDSGNQGEEINGDSKFTDTGESCTDKLPYIVVIVDEFADLMMVASRDVEAALIRLAQMARAAGIHLILATQRPSVDVLTGVIKANFPTRISFQVSSKIDSRTILDTNGSERLLGNGDMLFLPPGTGRLQRIQGAYVSEAEIARITGFLKAQKPPEYVEDVTKQVDNKKSDIDKSDYDEKYDEAVALITKTRQASISSVQRHLRIGYNRAARIIETMEKEGIIGPQEGSKPREIFVKSYDD